MNKKTVAKAYRIQLEVALEKIAKATRLAGDITSKEKWVAFDKTCNEANFLIVEALYCVPDGFLPEEDEKKLISSLKELHAIRIETWINWEMAKREAEAVRKPAGRYGHMKARREMLEGVLAADGNGHQQHPS